MVVRRDDELKAAPAVHFQNPLNPAQATEFDWYFTGYLHHPWGPSKARGADAEAGLKALGTALFEAVFGANDDSLTYYAAACEDGLSEYQLVIASPDHRFLGLPWELLKEPDGGYLLGQIASITRRLSSEPLAAFSGTLPHDQLNVLMVSPYLPPDPEPPDGPVGQASATSLFPNNESNSGFSSLAIETLQVLESLDVQVEFEFLRPASFEALKDRLASKPDHYHLVHLDAMVSGEPDLLLFSAQSDASPTFPASGIPASKIGEALAQGGVPVVLINANISDTGGAQPGWSSVPASIAEGGAPTVVSLPYPLAKPAGEIFLRSFYPALAQGRELASAVALACKEMKNNADRPTPAGKMPFWDWAVPKVYQSQTYTPLPISVESPHLTPRGLSQTQPEQQPDPIPRGGPHGLVGRRSELRALERLLEQNPVVLMWGDTGVGKTELALGLARWLQNTSARPGGVFYTSLEAGAGLERVIHETGTSIAGLEFADLPADQQRQWLSDHLREQPSLLIWDAIEFAAGFPAQGTGLLDQSEQAALVEFLQEVTQDGNTRALLVSRRASEPWLSGPHTSFQLRGLTRRDALELGNELLEECGALDSTNGVEIESRLGEDYLGLLELVEGHPLAMRIAAPLLKELPASVIFKEVQEIASHLGSSDLEEARPSYLTALMDYSFSRMPRRSRFHLTFLSLFQHRVMMDVLTHITQERAYRTVMGEELGWGACRTLLRSGREAGFLDAINPSVFQINSGVPWFLGRRLHGQLPPSGVRTLEQEFMRVYADTADFFMESLYENQDSGTNAVLAEEGNLNQALALTLETKQWDSAQLIVQPLAQVYRMQKRYTELRRLRRQLLEVVTPNQGGATEATAAGAIELWLYLLGTEAGESSELGDLAHAEDLNRQLLAHLTAQEGGDADPRTAAVHHQLGEVELQQGRLEQAEVSFQSSLRIIEAGEDKDSVADDYYSLGQVKHRQQSYAEAKDWFSKAVDIHQRSQDQEQLINDYRALGLACQFRLEHDEAESWYQRAREIVEENRDEDTAVSIYHELGTVCHARYQFEEADNWYRQALTLSDQLGKEAQMAVEFHHLGLLAQSQEIFYNDAENWFLMALAKHESLGDRRSAGDECRQLGVLFHQQKKLDEAAHWYQRASDIFQELGDMPRIARTYGQLGMVAEEQEDLPGALEWVARTYALAADHSLAVLPQTKSHLRRLRSKYGEDAFEAWWRGYMGSDPPSDLGEEE